MVCVEPSAGMVEVARSKAPAARFEVMRFEDFDETGFGLAACAQAHHWIDRETRDERFARALRPDGTAAIFFNAQYTPAETRTFFEAVQGVYREHAPPLAALGLDYVPPTENVFAARTDLFADLQVRHHPWSWTLSTADYVGLMSTHSPHAALDDDVRQRLLDGIAALIDSDFGGEVTEHYVAVLSLARRRS